MDGRTSIQAKRSKTVFLHIGTHKTGTTSIQNFLVQNAEALQQERILIPSAGRYLDGHHHIAWELRNDARLEGRTGYVQQLIDELQATSLETAVVSSEDFEYLSQYPDILKGFTEALRKAGIEPVFVVFFREQKAYLASLAAALANHGVRRAADWYSGELEENGAILVNKDWFFDFDRDRFVSRWVGITGARLVVCDYSACSEGDGVVPAFLKLLAVSEAMIARARSWPRLNARDVANIKGLAG